MTLLYSVCLKPISLWNHYSSFVNSGPSFHFARSHVVNPPVSIVRTMFLMQDVSETICTAHAGGALMQAIQNSMINCQGVPCFSHCKVTFIVKVTVPATLLQHLACMSFTTSTA